MAGKVKQNDFTVNIDEQVELVFNMLTEEQYAPLLKEMIKKEVIKKQDEVQKNYSDLGRFMADKFADKVYERLIKRVWFPNTRQAAAPVSIIQPAAELTTDESSAEEIVAVAAKSTSKAKAKSNR